MFIPDASVHIGSTTVTEVGQANPLHRHHAALIYITVIGEPDPVTAAIARHIGESGSVYLELPDGRLALILDLSGASRLSGGKPGISGISLPDAGPRSCCSAWDRRPARVPVPEPAAVAMGQALARAGERDR